MTLRSKLVGSLLKVAASLPSAWLELVEKFARLSLGKGWGSTTASSEVEAVSRFMRVLRLSQPIVALDIGANQGEWAAAFRQTFPAAKIYMFEPSSTACHKLSRRFDGDTRMIAVHAAVGREPGRATLWSDYPGSPLSSLSKRRLEHFGIALECSEDVSVVSLDQWCEDNHVKPTIVKHDVEGSEFEALVGAERILESAAVVQFEFGGTNIDSRTFLQDFFYFFRKHRFDLYRLGPAGPRRLLGYSEMDEAFQTTNYLAVRCR